MWKKSHVSKKYEVSDDGRIKNSKTGYVLKPQYRNGYCSVTICGKKYFVHRLVLGAFVGNSELHCNHINGLKDDNRISNLEYCTPQENNNHALNNHLVRSRGFYCVDKSGNILWFKYIVSASNKLGISRKMIEKCLSGERRSTHGYTFSRKVDDLPSVSFDSTPTEPKMVTNGIRIFESIGDASRKCGLSKRSIRSRLNGDVKSDKNWAFM